MGSRIYLLLTLGLYTVGVFHVLVQSLARKRFLASPTIGATLLGFALQTAYLSQRWTEAGHFPAVGLHDGASFLAWAIVLMYLLTYVVTKVDALGLMVHPVTFGLVLMAALAPVSEREDPILKSLFLPIHTTLAFFGYAALFVAFGMGLMYLVQERGLRSRMPNRFYYLAPSLERCDTISGRSVAVGFGFLSLAIVTGLLWSHSAKGMYWSGSAKEWSALAAWVIYVVLLLARHRSGWGGRRAALLGVAGFVVVLFTFLWINVLHPPGVVAP
ncbi:MAG TPA: cytochrome c biogenesis protein CcsA [Vicinamibacteria bacterium]|nr:cytochrome c biogenesis protein CcsA [Vicinamibacteria bacterium]